MFIHSGKLEHLLRPEDYSSTEFWQDEVEHLFRKSWQYIGVSDQLGKEGSYIARDIAGVPVVVRNFGGEIKGFRNVCPHRHSMIVKEGTGCTEKLKCMYHGWEFGEKGQISHLPDGSSFRGIKATDYCLTPVRLSRIGSLIFANLAPGDSTIQQDMPDLAAELDQYFGKHKLIWHWTTEHKTNWKIIEENAVESYHVPMAHPTTFTDYKAAELHDHRLNPAYTRYGDLEPWKTGIVDRGFKFLSKFLLPSPNYERFKHTHIFPNNLLYYNEIFSTWAFVQPVAAGVTRYEIVGFMPREVKGGWPMQIALRVIIQPLIKQFAKILIEDMDIWPMIHHGLENSRNKGVMSCREERVFAFQQYILDRLPEKWRNR
ncbi:MAG: aromatic ring-hydroxylating dioxygenase subunit alpha [Verrucomicrobiaceae bacterium]|nr:aromatic ring-hydroxylating dioxygenase subunit alpha [Verrucomicrobiaceae bacterium]